MFKYPGIAPKPIATAAQVCVYCNQWFTLPKAACDTLHKWWVNESKGHSFEHVNCSHCKASNLLISVGKYDRPNSSKERCAVQHVVTG